MFDCLTEIIGIVAIIALFIAFLFGLHTVTTIQEDKLWNDGHCSVCGGTWEYEQAVGHRSSTSYIYVCTKCGKRIELNEVR